MASKAKRLLNIGKALTKLNGDEVTRRNADGSEEPFSVKRLLCDVVENLSPKDSETAILLRDIGIQIARCEDDYVELDQTDYKILEREVRKQFLDREGAGNVLGKAALQEAFKEAEDLYRSPKKRKAAQKGEGEEEKE